MPDFNSERIRDATIAPPPPSGSVPNPGGSVTPSNSSMRHKNLLGETWLDQIREQLDDLSAGLRGWILELINQHHPGTPTGEHRWYYGSYNVFCGKWMGRGRS